MPNRVNCDVQTCYYEMSAGFNGSALIEYALEHHLVQTEKKAVSALSGLQQWLACLNHRRPSVLPYVMLEGPVSKIYTALVRNTIMYRNFCDRYMKDFVNTEPVTKEEAIRLVRLGCIDDTLRELSTAFSCELAPSLSKWFDRRGELLIVSVSSFVEPEKSSVSERKARWAAEALTGAR